MIKKTVYILSSVILICLLFVVNSYFNNPKSKTLALPDLRQMTTYTCGVSALQTILFYYGIDTREADLARKLKNTSSGTEVKHIVRVAKEYGLKANAKQMTAADLKNYIKQNIPVIIAIQAWADKNTNYEKDYDDGHYVVAIGYTPESFIFEDPSTIGRGFIPYSELEKRWHDVGSDNKKVEHLGIAIYGKKPKFNMNILEHID